MVRTISLSTGTRVAVFRDTIRQRDQRCVITGEEAVGTGEARWLSFQAAHIFPLVYEGHWNDFNYGRLITIQPDTGGFINSIQNGMLLDASINSFFDNYALSINPDV